MKNVILSLVLAAGSILPVVHAAPIGNTTHFANKTYGGFAPGKTFTFTVKQVVSSKANLNGVVKKTAVPAGVPKFKKGQKVKFKIGAKGQLTGPGFSIPYRATSPVSNSYYVAPTAKKPKGHIGIIHKKASNVATAAALNFFKTTGTGYSTQVYSVSYILE